MRATVSTFRRTAAAEEMMMRASMPRVSAADATPLLRNGEERVSLVHSNGTSRLVRPIVMFALGDVARIVEGGVQ